jgi:hypothetical protein
MNSYERFYAIVGVLGVAAAMFLVRQAAALDEVVVYGTPPAVALEAKPARVDVAGYLKTVDASLRTAVSEALKSASPNVAVASAGPARTRG